MDMNRPVDHADAIIGLSQQLGWLALWRVPRLGPVTLLKLLDSIGSPWEILKTPQAQLTKLGLNSRQVSLIHEHRRISEQLLAGETLLSVSSHPLARDLHWLSQEGHYLVCCDDEYYPPQLRAIHDAPPVLFVKGDPGVLLRPQIAMVGSRNPTRTGLALAEDFARYFAANGWVVTSGLAQGIDGAAHQGALNAQGCTIGVLAHGLDHLYPARHRVLAEQMLLQGALVSEFPIGTQPKANHFPRRNRIISGLSLGVLVVEAALKSGSLITATTALEQGREVFAIPGSIHNPVSRGCHALIRQGARLVESAVDVLEELAPLLQYQFTELKQVAHCKTLEAGLKVNDHTQLDDEQKKVLGLIDTEPQTLEQLVSRTQMDVSRLRSMMSLLELEGVVVLEQSGYRLASAP